MIAAAAKVRIALADHSKFGKQSFAFVGPVTDISILVTDNATPVKEIRQLRECGVEVVVAEVNSKSAERRNRSDSRRIIDNRSQTT